MKNNTLKTLFAAAMVLVAFTSGCKKDDVTAPVVTLSGSTASVPVGTSSLSISVMAMDDVDGDISSSIVITGALDLNTPGVYTRIYTATDKAGNSGSATLTVTVTMTATAALGNYSTTTTCTNYPYNTVATSTTFQAGSVSSKFVINMFYFNGGTLTCTVAGNEVTVDAGQNPNPIGDGVSGSGTFNSTGKSLTMNYTFQPNGGSPTSCSVTYSRP